MAIATFVFWLGTRRYTMIPPSRVTRSAGFLAVLSEALRSRRRRPPGSSLWEGALGRYSQEEVRAASSVGPILSVFAMIPVFWALFDQTHSTWVAQGKQMIAVQLPFKLVLDAAAMQSINPLMVMILVPLLTLAVYPRIGTLAAPLKRMSLGMFLGALSFVVVAWLQRRLEAGDSLSILWQTVPYLILTTAEVLVSTTGLEFAFREAAASMKSTIMGFWNLTVAVGNLLVMGITGFLGNGHGDSAVSPGRFMLYAGLTVVVGLAFSIIAAGYKYRDPEAAAGR
jgi:POT family proton-dependent oligopeptide transporter